MFTELMAAILIAFGLLFLYILSTKKDEDYKKYLYMFFLCILFVYAGIVLLNITWAMAMSKMKALVVLALGVFFFFYFPGNLGEGYQHEEFGVTGMFFGAILLVLGLYWLLF